MVDRKKGRNKQSQGFIVAKKGRTMGMMLLTSELVFVLVIVIALLYGLVFGIFYLVKSDTGGLISCTYILIASQILWKLYRSVLRKVNKL